MMPVALPARVVRISIPAFLASVVLFMVAVPAVQETAAGGVLFLGVVTVHFIWFMLRTPRVDALVLEVGVATYLVLGVLYMSVLIARLVGLYSTDRPGADGRWTKVQ